MTARIHQRRGAAAAAPLPARPGAGAGPAEQRTDEERPHEQRHDEHADEQTQEQAHEQAHETSGQDGIRPLTGPDDTEGGPGAPSRPRRRLGLARPLGVGVVTLWLSVIVLLPLAALTVASFDEGLSGFWDAVTAPTALAALWVTVLVSAVVAVVNAVLGTLVAWVLVRDEFPGKRLVNALIDLPFALPTIVASIVLLSLYGPNSPIGVELNATRWGVVVALLFVTLPFVVRSVQPVLIEADREVEEAAASLGASNWTTFRRIVLPTLAPAVLGGTGLAFARAIGEYGSVVLIGGNIPRETQVASQYIQQQIEIDRPLNAAAVSVALLVIAFVTLLVLRVLSNRSQRREERDV
ncbi:sulfate ABC transporter permease subunit CysT [Terrabacter sp. 2RAF25]|uniref:sulfate ABC transporter permease subunit CysT n=1 Tax=Terrabacter sp. 2RAF25 TaxID=3232998 RepID=UPI003F9D236B